MENEGSAPSEQKPDVLNIKVVAQVRVARGPGCRPRAGGPCSLKARRRMAHPHWQDGTEIFFKCKPHTQMKKLMEAYAARQGVQLRALRFLFDGERIQEGQTPQDLGLEDQDSIDVVMEQVGGGA